MPLLNLAPLNLVSLTWYSSTSTGGPLGWDIGWGNFYYDNPRRLCSLEFPILLDADVACATRDVQLLHVALLLV